MELYSILFQAYLNWKFAEGSNLTFNKLDQIQDSLKHLQYITAQYNSDV